MQYIVAYRLNSQLLKLEFKACDWRDAMNLAADVLPDDARFVLLAHADDVIRDGEKLCVIAKDA